MKKLNLTIPVIGLTVLTSRIAHAGVVPTVPEIDAGMAATAIGLTVGILALIREHRRRK